MVLEPVARLLGRSDDRPTPIRHGHDYVDTITGEVVRVTSVGPSVELERNAVSNRAVHMVRQDVFRTAVEHEIVVHDTDRCTACRSSDSGTE
jgi:hypothetical protein